MLTVLNTSNLNVILAFLYMFYYSLTFFLFFFLIFNEVQTNQNLNATALILNFSKNKKNLLVLTLMSFLGIPPLAIFAAKFSGLAGLWNQNQYLFFFLGLLSTFISFALYLQMFDMLFSKKIKSVNVFKLVKHSLNLYKLSEKKIKIYEYYYILFVLSFFVLFGVLFFKDFIILLKLFF